jgi:hypothetical protein
MGEEGESAGIILITAFIFKKSVGAVSAEQSVVNET